MTTTNRWLNAGTPSRPAAGWVGADATCVEEVDAVGRGVVTIVAEAPEDLLAGAALQAESNEANAITAGAAVRQLHAGARDTSSRA
jgi:hypothetical protein